MVQRILDESFQLLRLIGVKVHAAEARKLLADGGSSVNEAEQVVKILEFLGRQALESVPSHFNLYNRQGEAVVSYRGDAGHFCRWEGSFEAEAPGCV